MPVLNRLSLFDIVCLVLGVFHRICNLCRHLRSSDLSTRQISVKHCPNKLVDGSDRLDEFLGLQPVEREGDLDGVEVYETEGLSTVAQRDWDDLLSGRSKRPSSEF